MARPPGVVPRRVRCRRSGWLALVLLFVVSLPAVTSRLYASDEIQYFAFLRSLWFDHDLSFENEYRYFYDRGIARSEGFHETFLELRTDTGRRINFGTIGFLAAAEREELESGLEHAFSGDFEVMTLPGLAPEIETAIPIALNDVSFIRKPHGRVAELSYRLGGQEVGHVRCDGLVAATPAGSTGYNLANQGPILAWGVEGYVVSFIAPHTLTARALVVAPDDVLHVANATGRDRVDVVLDGEHVSELASGEEVAVRFRDGIGHLAQLPGSNFYRRIREKFGHLAH